LKTPAPPDFGDLFFGFVVVKVPGGGSLFFVAAAGQVDSSADFYLDNLILFDLDLRVGNLPLTVFPGKAEVVFSGRQGLKTPAPPDFGDLFFGFVVVKVPGGGSRFLLSTADQLDARFPWFSILRPGRELT
jgi:hypothetical protein